MYADSNNNINVFLFFQIFHVIIIFIHLKFIVCVVFESIYKHLNHDAKLLTTEEIHHKRFGLLGNSVMKKVLLCISILEEI